MKMAQMISNLKGLFVTSMYVNAIKLQPEKWIERVFAHHAKMPAYMQILHAHAFACYT
jgi:hypothetical protein